MTGHDLSSLPILVVEDDLPLLKLVQRRLEKHGYQTEGVTSGTTAIAWLEKHSAQLMLLDYSLPDMLGEQLLEELAERHLAVPFVVATGHGSETVAVEMLKRGARDYLIKGAAFLKLLPTVIEQTLAQLDQERRLAEAEEELRRAHDELERRVQERTEELAEINVRLVAEMEERKRAEELASRHLAELAHVSRLSTVGEMAAELAHELNQPLAAISSYSQACVRLLQSSGQDNTEDLTTFINRAIDQADRAAGIVRHLRRFTRKTKPVQELLDINVLVREIAALAQVEAHAAQVELRFQLTEPCPPVLADRIQIEQVLINLIRNALEAMEEPQVEFGTVTVQTLVADNNRIQVAVCDQGIGVPDDVLPADWADKVFERYFTTKPDGMGMGLPISRTIVESYGGDLRVAANPESGATFTFSLPIYYGDRHSGK